MGVVTVVGAGVGVWLGICGVVVVEDFGDFGVSGRVRG